MAPRISIIIPHKRSSLNNYAMVMNHDILYRNTIHNFELIIDTECPKDPYKIWNEAAQIARGEILVFSNSDVLMARGWDVPFVENMENNAIFTGYLIEPGNIGVADVNINQDFGKTPREFDEQTFEAFVADHRSKHQKKKEERGWYLPCAFLKEWFLNTGGFDTTLGFPNPNDILFWNRVVKEYNTKLYRVTSYAYHFQNLSGRSE